MSAPLNEEDQVFRLICCGIAFLGSVIHDGVGQTAQVLNSQCDRAFEAARTAGIWPIVKGV